MSKQGRDVDLFAVVIVGGVIGALARYAFDLAIPAASDGWATATFVVNMTGCALLGAVLIIARYLVPDPKASRTARLFRPFVITGLLGGYTTFSTYSVETYALTQAGKWGLGVTYAISSIVCGVFLVWIAMRATEFGFRKAGWLRPTAVQAVGAAIVTREAEDEA